jgi:hypothetical protein
VGGLSVLLLLLLLLLWLWLWLWLWLFLCCPCCCCCGCCGYCQRRCCLLLLLQLLFLLFVELLLLSLLLLVAVLTAVVVAVVVAVVAAVRFSAGQGITIVNKLPMMKTTVGLVSYKQNAKPSNPGSLTNPFSLMMCSANVLPSTATQASISDKAAAEKNSSQDTQ